MSKFVTYGVTEMLDNDQKFIIDSDRTGPGSITAKDAASSLLSKWAGFETFEEAVQNTVSNNQEFIDRDTAIRSETAELKKKIVTTFPAKEASGAVATFESEFEDAPLKSCIVQIDPVQDLHGYDHPWPAGGGKNLFQTTATTQTLYGTTFTVNADGTVTAVGTPTVNINGGYSFGEVMLPAGNYKLNGNSNPNTDLRLTCYNVTTSSVIASIYNNNDLSFTLSEESVVRLYPFVSTSFGGSAITMKPMIRLASESDATFAPYENICPISGWTGCEVQRTGKNLFGGEAFRDAVLAAVSTATTGEDENGRYVTITASSASHEKVIFEYPWKENTVYTFIYRYKKNNTNGITNLSIKYKDGTYNYLSKYGGVEADTVYMEVVKSVKNKLISDVRAVWGSGTATIYYDDFGVFEGDISVDDFIPYTGQTYPITFPTEAGTVYGAYVDVTGGELVVTRYGFDGGDVVWKKTNDYRFGKFFTETTPFGKFLSNVPTVISSRYKSASNYNASSKDNNYVWIRSLTATIRQLRVKDDDYDEYTADEFRTAMTGTQFVYELAEPIEIPLKPQEIKTLLGTNNVWSNTGDTAVEYLMSDVSWYVEKKLRAFQSILAGVEDSTSASKNYSANTYLIFNNDIYRVTKAITAGETIEEGVNVTKTTVAEQLMALAQA